MFWRAFSFHVSVCDCCWCRAPRVPAEPDSLCTPQRKAVTRQTSPHPVITGQSASSSSGTAEDDIHIYTIYTHTHSHTHTGTVTSSYVFRIGNLPKPPHTVQTVCTTKEHSPLFLSPKPWRPALVNALSGGRKSKNSRERRKMSNW